MTVRPGKNAPTKQCLKPDSFLQVTLCTPALTSNLVEPTPTPLAVCSSGEVVRTFVTRSPLWNVTVTRL